MFSLIKKSYQQLTKSEKKFLFWGILIILFLSSLALIFAKLTEDSDYLTGVNVVAGADKPVYLSQIEQARQGHILFKNLYSSEPQQARFFAPIWLFLGWLGKLTGLSNLTVFHLARVILGAGFLILLYLFLSRVFKKVIYRKLSFLILGFASGFGLFTLQRYISEEIMYEYYGTDLWVSEGNTFLTLVHSPLFILSQIFMLLIFWWVIERFKNSSYLEVMGWGLITLFLGIFHPYDLIIIYAVLAIWLVMECLRSKRIIWPIIFKFVIIVCFSFLAIIYFLWLFKTETTIGNWAVQNLTVSPRFLNYLMGYGLLFFTTIIALFKLTKSQNVYYRFLSLWVIVGWFLLFIPLQFQRRLSNGLHIPMAIVGFIGLVMIVNWLKKAGPKIYHNFVFQSASLVLIIILLTVTNLYNILQNVFIYSYHHPPHYASQEVYQAIIWFKNNIESNKVILAEPVNGNIIPSISANVVYIGHGHQTINWDNKLAKVNSWFFVTNKQDEAKKEWLQSQGIDYVFFSQREDNLGDFQPAEKDYLEEVYHNKEVKIFKVKFNK